MNSLPSTHHSLRTSQKGFTLIEILIVVGIIGLLASVVLSGLGSVRSRGRDARRVADLRQVQQGLELYYTRYQEYPDETDWSTLEQTLKGAQIGITNISSDPLCGSSSNSSCENNYQYFSKNGEEYVLQALLEDRNSPLMKGSFQDAFNSSHCGGTKGSDRIYYCVKF